MSLLSGVGWVSSVVSTGSICTPVVSLLSGVGWVSSVVSTGSICTPVVSLLSGVGWVSSVVSTGSICTPVLSVCLQSCSFGYHAGGWGKPPVDEIGKPLYGDVFGTQTADFQVSHLT